MNGFFEELSFWMREDVLGERVFPRQIHLHRDIAYNEYDIYNEMDNRWFRDAYAAVFSEYQITRRLFDTIFIDIDPSNKRAIPIERIEDAYYSMRIVLNRLEDAGIKSRVYFSGNGFHIYIDFNPTRIEHYGGVVREFLKRIGVLDLADTHVIGDIRRMARLPRTRNTKSGFVSFRVDPDWSWDILLEHILNEEYVQLPMVRHRNAIVNELVELDNKIEPAKKARQHNDIVFKNWSFDAMPMCIREGILRLKYTGELEHYWRLVLALFLLRAVGYDKTVEIFKYGSDFDEEKTKYQLDRIIARRLNEYGCDKIREMGICPYNDTKKCPFYPSMNAWLPDWDEVEYNETE